MYNNNRDFTEHSIYTLRRSELKARKTFGIGDREEKRRPCSGFEEVAWRAYL